MKRAEKRFKDAFERLKKGDPKVLPKGTAVTQANVSREAGYSPSALKKSRFPILVEEIQAYLSLNVNRAASAKKNPDAGPRSMKKRLADCQAQRDKLSSVVAAQQRHIEMLQEEITRLKSVHVEPLSSRKEF